MPYNPGTEYRGDQYLFRGISGLGEDLGKAITRHREEKRESQFLDSAFETMAAALPRDRVTPEMVKQFDGFSGKSLSQKRGTVAQMGFLMKQLADQDTLEQRKAEAKDAATRSAANTALFARQVGLQEAGAARAEDERQKRETFGALLGRFLQTPQVTGSVSTPVGGVPMMRRPQLTPEIVAEFMGKSGAIDPGTASDLARTAAANREAFRPEVVTLDDGSKAMTTSRGSAIPLRAPTTPGAMDLKTAYRLRAQLRATQANIGATPETRAAVAEDIAAIDDMIAELSGAAPVGGGKGDVSPASATAAGGKRVSVVDPQGRKGTVPEEQLGEALKRGYQRAK